MISGSPSLLRAKNLKSLLRLHLLGRRRSHKTATSEPEGIQATFRSKNLQICSLTSSMSIGRQAHCACPKPEAQKLRGEPQFRQRQIRMGNFHSRSAMGVGVYSPAPRKRKGVATKDVQKSSFLPILVQQGNSPVIVPRLDNHSTSRRRTSNSPHKTQRTQTSQSHQANQTAKSPPHSTEPLPE